LQNYGLLEDCRFYKIFEEGNLIGQFFYSDSVAFFAYDNNDFRIDMQQSSFKKAIYKIIDQKIPIEIGRYEITTSSNKSNYRARLFLDDRVFECQNLKPDVKHNISHKNTWGHYKIAVWNKNEDVTFNFKLDMPWISTQKYRLQTFAGTIELTGNSILLVFSSLFLLEQVFINKDDFLLYM